MGNTVAEIRIRSLRSLIPPHGANGASGSKATSDCRKHVYDAGCGALVLYQREIAYAISDPEIKRVTLVKPMRVGFTTLLTGAIGNFVANEEAPSLVTQVRGFELAAVGVAK